MAPNSWEKLWLNGAAQQEGAAVNGRVNRHAAPPPHDSQIRIAELERQLTWRTLERDTARQALDRQFLDAAEVPNAEGHALSARLHGIAREMQHISDHLEQRNVALATANRQLEQRVAERTAALEAALDAKRDSEARFRRVADGVPQLIWTSHPEGRWDYANRRWQAYTGQEHEETHGLRWLEMVHPEDRDRTMAAWHAAVMDGGKLFVEHRIRGADGEYRWFETQAGLTADSKGGAQSPDARWVGYTSDIHARKLAQQVLQQTNAALEQELARRRQELAESEGRFRAYFQISPEPLFVVIAAPDGRFLHEAFNAPFERLTGLQENRAQGRAAHVFMPAATAAVFEAHYRICLDADLPHVFDALLALPAGDRILRVTLVPTRGSDGSSEATRCLLGSVRDLSNAPSLLLSPCLDA